MNQSYYGEPFDYVKSLYRGVQEPLVRGSITFDGHLDLVALRRAIKDLRKAYPLMNCSYDETSQQWINRSFSLNDYLFLKTNPKNNDDKAALLAGLGSSSNAPLKITVLIHQSYDVLVLTISHLLMDGRGFLDFFYLLAEAYSEEAQGQTFTTTLPLMERSLNSLYHSFSFKERYKIICHKQDKKEAYQEKSLPLLKEAGQDGYLLYQVASKPLVEYAQKQGVTLNDVLLTAYARVLHSSFGWDEVNLPCPIDLRRYIKGEYGLANYVGRIYAKTSIKDEEDFIATLKKIHATLDEQKKDAYCLRQPLLLHKFYHYLSPKRWAKILKKNSLVPVTSYTNLGVIDSTKLFFKGLIVKDFTLLTALKHPPFFQLSVATFKDTLTFTSAGHYSKGNLEVINQLYEAFIKELEGLR